jgi:hypothetical protein
MVLFNEILHLAVAGDATRPTQRPHEDYSGEFLLFLLLLLVEAMQAAMPRDVKSVVATADSVKFPHHSIAAGAMMGLDEVFPASHLTAN